MSDEIEIVKVVILDETLKQHWGDYHHLPKETALKGEAEGKWVIAPESKEKIQRDDKKKPDALTYRDLYGEPRSR